MSDDPLDFSGRAVLVTGGSRGIGRAIAEAFLGAGADVAVCGRNEPDELPSAGAKAAAFHAVDVRDAEAVDAMVASLAGELGRLDVVVNNAGGSPTADAATASPRFSTAVVTLNLLAPLFVGQAANRVMQNQGTGGSIVNVSSVSGLRPSPGTAAYGAAKAGLVSLTQTLAVEWAPTVRVNCVSAGLTETDPAAAAAACLYLSSPLAGYVSGANLVLHDGGERPAYLGALADDRSGVRQPK